MQAIDRVREVQRIRRDALLWPKVAQDPGHGLVETAARCVGARAHLITVPRAAPSPARRSLRNVPMASSNVITMPNVPGPAKKYFHEIRVLKAWLATSAQARY